MTNGSASGTPATCASSRRTSRARKEGSRCSMAPCPVTRADMVGRSPGRSSRTRSSTLPAFRPSRSRSCLSSTSAPRYISASSAADDQKRDRRQGDHTQNNQEEDSSDVGRHIVAGIAHVYLVVGNDEEGYERKRKGKRGQR